MIHDFLNFATDGAQRLYNFFNPAQENQNIPPSEEGAQPKEPENIPVEKEDVREEEVVGIPEPKEEDALETHLELFRLHGVALTTKKAQKAHEEALRLNSNMEVLTELVSHLRTRLEEDQYDFSNDPEMLQCVEQAKQCGVEIPANLNKSQCTKWISLVEGKTRSIDVKLKTAMNKFNEHSRLRDNYYEAVKTCYEKLHGAKQKIIRGIG